MKKLLFIIFLIAVWALGIYEDDCTVAVGLSLFCCMDLMDKLMEKRKQNAKRM